MIFPFLPPNFLLISYIFSQIITSSKCLRNPANTFEITRCLYSRSKSSRFYSFTVNKNLIFCLRGATPTLTLSNFKTVDRIVEVHVLITYMYLGLLGTLNNLNLLNYTNKTNLRQILLSASSCGILLSKTGSSYMKDCCLLSLISNILMMTPISNTIDVTQI